MKKSLAILLVLLCSLLFGESCLAFDGTGTVHRGDRVGIMGNIDIDQKTAGDVVAVMGNITVEADVDGDVVAILGNVSVNAKINGDVVNILGNVLLKEKADISGGLVSFGNIDRLPGAVVKGEEVRVAVGSFGLNGQEEDALYPLSRLLFSILVITGILGLILGLVILSLSRNRFERMVEEIEIETAKKFSMGVLIIISIPLVIMLSVITVIGPPIMVIAASILTYLGRVVISVYLGRKIYGLFHTELNIYAEFITGMLILLVANATIILLAPQTGAVGAIVLYLLYSLFVNAIGLGAVFITQFGSGGVKKKVSYEPGMDLNGEKWSFDRDDGLEVDFDPKKELDMEMATGMEKEWKTEGEEGEEGGTGHEDDKK